MIGLHFSEMAKTPDFIKVDIAKCTQAECEEHLLYLRYLLRREPNLDKQNYYNTYIAKIDKRLKELKEVTLLIG